LTPSPPPTRAGDVEASHSIDADDVDVRTLPPWASEVLPARGLALASAGVVVRTGRRRATAARWEQIFGVAVLDAGDTKRERLLLLVPRPPPDKPWIEVRRPDLPTDLATLDALADALRRRLSMTGYRGAPAMLPRLAPEQLLARARAHAPIPGAVEIPIARRRSLGNSRPVQTLIGVSGGGAFAVAMAMSVAVPLAVPIVAALGVAGAVAGGTAVDLALRAERKEGKRRRVLLLAPDGCICGFETGVVAFAWSDIRSFHEAPARFPTLVVEGSHQDVLGRLESVVFDAPLPLVVAVAEAYRNRAART